MCGICGFIGVSQNIDNKSMLSALKHRGPDDEGDYKEQLSNGESLWFGHRRLSIIDLSSAGHQPMQSFDGRLVICYNGEIYNYEEIKRELETHGYVFRSRSDTEVILSAWDLWGEASIERLRGMFAFAIWDKKQRMLWLVRDRLGEKPLYYTWQNNRLLFSSEIRSLLASGVIERRLDSDGLDSYLAFGSVSQPYTLVKHIKSLEPGHFLRFQKKSIKIHEYWSLRDIEECTKTGVDEIIEKVHEVLNESIRFCMVSDVPVGILLSGGVDSTAILSQLHRQGYSNLNTYSVLFDGVGEEYSEEIWSRANSGLKVAITGQGADELFWGYGRHRRYKLLTQLTKLSFSQRILNNIQSFSNSIFPEKMQINKILNLFEKGDPYVLAYMTRHLIFNNQEICRLRAKRRPSQSRFVKQDGGTHPLEILYRLESDHYLRNTLLRDGDQMSMANSLELRAPFVDYRLVELVNSIPFQYKSFVGRQKPLLVDAVNDDLVRQIAKRPKVFFAIPLKIWFKSDLGNNGFLDATDLFERNELIKMKMNLDEGNYFLKSWTIYVLMKWIKKLKMLPPID
jgi:asparagine synthase (glutamine-hydrolysing)